MTYQHFSNFSQNTLAPSVLGDKCYSLIVKLILNAIYLTLPKVEQRDKTGLLWILSYNSEMFMVLCTTTPLEIHILQQSCQV